MATAALVVPVNEAATALSVGRTTIYELISAGHLKVVKIGRATRVTVESIQAVASGECVGTVSPSPIGRNR